MVERVGTLIGTRVARQSSRPSRDSGFFIGQGSNRETGETPARITTSDAATRPCSALDRVASTYDAIWRRQWLRHGRLGGERGGFNRRDARRTQIAVRDEERISDERGNGADGRGGGGTSGDSPAARAFATRGAVAPILPAKETVRAAILTLRVCVLKWMTAGANGPVGGHWTLHVDRLGESSRGGAAR